MTKIESVTEYVFMNNVKMVYFILLCTYVIMHLSISF